eukprot:1567227-Pyramimonas_sp.AAC.1
MISRSGPLGGAETSCTAADFVPPPPFPIPPFRSAQTRGTGGGGAVGRLEPYIAPIVLPDHIPEMLSSAQASAERVSAQCRTSASQGPTRESPRVWGYLSLVLEIRPGGRGSSKLEHHNSSRGRGNLDS